MEEEILTPEQVEERPAVAEDISFDRKVAQQLYVSGFMETHPHRWLRAREEIRFEDVVEKLTGHTSAVISCPFHGKDSTPSFHVYRRTNDAYCFGCPPGKQFYDAVIFTAEKLGISKLHALKWLEREFDLPEIADIDSEELKDELEGDMLTVTFRDLLGAYVQHAQQDIQTSQDVELAKEYLEILFDAWPSRTEEKLDPNAGDAMALVRVVGEKVLRYIFEKKKAR